MASPLADAFKQRLTLFKDQQSGVAKDRGLAQRINKLKSGNKNDFNQQTQIQNTVVKNTATISASSGPGQQIKNFIPGTKALVVGSGTGGISKPSKGGTKVLAQGKQWTTSGFVPLKGNIFKPMDLKAKAQKKKVS